MFGFKIISKAEKLLWLATIQDLKEQIKQLRIERDRERARAESALNALLARTQNLALNLDSKEIDTEAVNRMAFDIFQDAEQTEKLRKEAEEIERIQG